MVPAPTEEKPHRVCNLAVPHIFKFKLSKSTTNKGAHGGRNNKEFDQAILVEDAVC
jgi:hypothetical protein